MPQVLVDHQHPRRRPPQRDRPLGQPVLQPRRLLVIVDLRRGGLADIDRRQPITMPGLDLALQPAPRAASPRRSPRSPPFPPLTTAACTIRSTSRPSRRPTSHPVHLRERLPHRRGRPARPAKGARQHLQTPLTSLVRPGLHLTQPPDIRGHGQQAVNSYDRRIPSARIHLCMQSGLLLEHTFRFCSSRSSAGPPQDPRPGRRRPVDLADHRRLRPAPPRPAAGR